MNCELTDKCPKYPTPTQESEVCSYFAAVAIHYTSPPIDLHTTNATFATHSEVSNVKAVVGTVNKKKAGIFIYTLNNIVKSRWQIQ